MICARSASIHGSAAPASSALVSDLADQLFELLERVLISPNVALQRFVTLAQVRGALHPLFGERRSRLSCRALLNQRFVELALSLAQRHAQAHAVLPGALGEGAQPGQLFGYNRVCLAEHHRLFGAQSSAS
jgi:hypothetical protein